VLSSDLLPTPLIDAAERSAVPVSEDRHWGLLRPLAVIWRLAGFVYSVWRLRIARQGRRKKWRDRAIARLRRLGTLWLKTVQLLSLRSDLLPDDLGEAVLNLRDQGVARPFHEIRAVVEAELGEPLANRFVFFDEIPFGATAVSQIHRARLPGVDRDVAVKVQQPHARRVFELDLRLIRWAAWLLSALSINANMRWTQLFFELKDLMIKELNYQYEASSLEILKKNLAGRPVYAPDIFPELCSERMLTMEFIRAALLSDAILMMERDPARLNAWLKVNGIDLARAGERLFRTVYRQVFEDNFFHGDMHPANLILLRDGNIAIIDCRSVGSVDAESLAKQALFLKGIAEQEYAMAADLFFLLADRLPLVDLSAVKTRLIRSWQAWEKRVFVRGLPFREKSLSALSREVNRIVLRRRFAAQWSMSRMAATWANLDAALEGLSPDINYVHQLRRYFQAAERRRAAAQMRRTAARLVDSWEALREVTMRAEEMALFQDAVMRRQAQAAQGATNKLGLLLAAFFSFVSLASLVVGGFAALGYAGRFLDAPLRAALGPQLASLATWLPELSPLGAVGALAGLAWLYFTSRANSRRFLQRDVASPGTTVAI